MAPKWTRRMLRRAGAFVVAVAALELLGSIAHTVRIQAAWSAAAGLADGAAPVAIPTADRIAWAVHDVQGLALAFGLLGSAALLVAFLVAGLVARYTGHRSAVFVAAGGCAIFVLFRALRLMLGTVGIFGARGVAGLALQVLVGAFAGLLFARLTRYPQATRTGG